MNREKLSTYEGDFEFEMTFRTIKNLDKRYGHQGAIEIFDNIIDFNGPNFTDSTLKVLECCCITRDLQEGELESILKPSFENIRKIDEVACKLVLGFLGESENEGAPTEKKINTSQKINED